MTSVAHKLRDRVAFGIAMVLLSSLLTASQEATFKFASSDMTVWQIFVMRSALVIPIFLLAAAIRGTTTGTWSGALRPWPMARAIMFVLMYLVTYSVLPFLHLSTVGAGLYTAPLFVAALSPIMLGEPVRWRGALAILVGFCGVLVMLRPGTEAFTWKTLFPVLGGFFYAVSAMITRAKCRDVAPSALAVSLAVALLVTGAGASIGLMVVQPGSSTVALSPFVFGQWSVLGTLEWAVIVILTLLLLGNGLALPAAYQAAPTFIIATFDYCFLVFATLLGFLVFGEVPDFQAVLGMVLIVIAGLVVVLR